MFLPVFVFLCASYLLNRCLHDVANYAHVLALTHAKDTADGLVFYVRVPLRLEYVYPARHEEVV